MSDRKGRADFYQPGDWNVACSMCGRKRKASYMVRNWQGMYRCPEHNEPRQPQDFVRGLQDIQTVPFSQPETDIDIPVCTFNGISGRADVGIADCAMAENPTFDPTNVPGFQF